ncbi:MAG: hypothetical protein IJ794_16525 [Lachnospiraceae bacterium]|nr:hypothetical protein [Lachnospiraceae bacterium]
MKNFKKLFTLMSAAACCAALSVLPAVKAEAATTFYVKYDTDMDEWRIQSGKDKWEDEDAGRELYYLNNGDNKVNDGDIVVVLPNDEDATGGTEIVIDSHLSNLTINRADAIVRTKGIDECYVFGDSYTAITGDVANAYVYDNAVCTFNSNVTNLNLISSNSNSIESTVSVKGTVAYALLKNPNDVIAQYYNFRANTFFYDDESALLTDDADYSKNGSVPAASTSTTTAASTTPTTAAATTTASSSSSSAYDDVPKTGEGNLAVWLFAGSILSFAGCLVFRKKHVTE